MSCQVGPWSLGGILQVRLGRVGSSQSDGRDASELGLERPVVAV